MTLARYIEQAVPSIEQQALNLHFSYSGAVAMSVANIKRAHSKMLMVACTLQCQRTSCAVQSAAGWLFNCMVQCVPHSVSSLGQPQMRGNNFGCFIHIALLCTGTVFSNIAPSHAELCQMKTHP